MSKRVRAFLVAETSVEQVNNFLAELAYAGVSDADVAVQVLPAPTGPGATFVAVVTYTDRTDRAPQEREPAGLAASAATRQGDPVRVQGSTWR